MKTKNFFKKTIASLLLSISPVCFARPDVNQFLIDYDALIQIMIHSYHEEVKSPLDTKIFDISQPLYYNFLSNSTHRQYSKEFLAMMYFPNFKVNNKNTDFCFILYDGKKLGQLDTYLNISFQTPSDAIYYLAAHEMGHCIAAHQRTLGNIPVEPNEKKEEEIADMFAIGFFLSRNQDAQAQKIIQLISNLPPDDIHSNTQALQAFYNRYKYDNPTIHNVYELFKTCYQYYQENNIHNS